MKKTPTKKEKIVETPASKAKLLEGVVVSNKMQKTIIVQVDRFVKHLRYGKYYTVSKKFKVHTEDEKASNPGDKVTIKACRPISKDKAFVLVK